MIIHVITFIIANNYEFTWGPQLATSIRVLCSVRLRGILESRLCQESPLEDEFDIIEAKCWGVNEQVNVAVYIWDLNKDEVEVLTMQERILFAAKFWYHILEGRAITLEQRTHSEFSESK